MASAPVLARHASNRRLAYCIAQDRAGRSGEMHGSRADSGPETPIWRACRVGMELGASRSEPEAIPGRGDPKEDTVLRYAIIFLVVAIIAAVLGFGGIAGAAAGIAKILAIVFLVLFVGSLIFGRRKSL
jgi:uncharacterized membrane protein YtjA (UPF0391 family)